MIVDASQCVNVKEQATEYYPLGMQVVSKLMWH
jgi:hypothetical protein